MTYPVLEQISGHLFKSMTVTKECTFTLEIKKGTRVEFELSDQFAEFLQKNNSEKKMTTTLGKRFMEIADPGIEYVSRSFSHLIWS